jgi:hypothetical protein
MPIYRGHLCAFLLRSCSSSRVFELLKVDQPGAGRANMHTLTWCSLTPPLIPPLLPCAVRSVLEQHSRLYELLEVVMDLGRPPHARFPGCDEKLAEEPVTQEDLDFAVTQVGGGTQQGGCGGRAVCACAWKGGLVRSARRQSNMSTGDLDCAVTQVGRTQKRGL